MVVMRNNEQHSSLKESHMDHRSSGDQMLQTPALNDQLGLSIYDAGSEHTASPWNGSRSESYQEGCRIRAISVKTSSKNKVQGHN